MQDDASLGSVPTSLSPLAGFEEFLKSRGKRLTQQSRDLVDHVFQQHDHIDEDGLIPRLFSVAALMFAPKENIRGILTSCLYRASVKVSRILAPSAFECAIALPPPSYKSRQAII